MVNPNLDRNQRRNGQDSGADDDVEEIRRVSSPDEYYPDEFAQLWNFINGGSLVTEDLTTHPSFKARERWRMNYESETEYKHATDDAEVINDFIYAYDDLANELFGNSVNSPENHYTLFADDNSISSDSSAGGPCFRSKIVKSDVLEAHTAKNSCDKANTEATKEDKNAVWVYSHKDRQRGLSEGEFELVHIPSTDVMQSTSSDSTAMEEIKQPKSLSSNYPPSYIPRLNLDNSLPTVTEVAEGKSSKLEKEPQPSRRTGRSPYVSPTQTNNWVHTTADTSSKSDTEKSTNVKILSPRDKSAKNENKSDKFDEISPVKLYEPYDEEEAKTYIPEQEAMKEEYQSLKSYDSHPGRKTYRTKETQTAKLVTTSVQTTTDYTSRNKQTNTKFTFPSKLTKKHREFYINPKPKYASETNIRWAERSSAKSRNARSDTQRGTETDSDRPDMWFFDDLKEIAARRLQDRNSVLIRANRRGIPVIDSASYLQTSDGSGEEEHPITVWSRCLDFFLCK